MFVEPGKFEGLLVTKDLFDRIRKYTVEKRLSTSTYDHGRGVNRLYTLKYCLQTNYHQNPNKYYIKSGGRHPPHLWFLERKLAGSSLTDSVTPSQETEILEVLASETPSYEALLANIMRKYPGDVLHVYRRGDRSDTLDFGSLPHSNS